MDLSFSPPSLDRYPCLRLAMEAMNHGASAPLVFNAANEVAVDAFLRNRIGFLDISRIIEDTLNNINFISTSSVDELLSLDDETRQCTQSRIKQIG